MSDKRNWVCLKCGDCQKASQQDIAESGVPWCADCDCTMVLAGKGVRPKKPVQIVVEVRGGVVQAVYASKASSKIGVLVLDHDDMQGVKHDTIEWQEFKAIERQTKKMKPVY